MKVSVKIFQQFLVLPSLNSRVLGSGNFSSRKCSTLSETKLPEPVSINHFRYDPKIIDPTKCPIFIYHGLFGSKINWRTLSKAIGTKTHRMVYSLDVRNHGQSAHSELLSYSAMVSDAVNFMENRKLKKTILLGHSLGGRAFAQFSSFFPEKVEKLIIVDIGISSYNSDPLLDYVNAMKKCIQELSAQTLSDAKKEMNEKLKPVVSDPLVRAFLLTSLSEEKENKFQWNFNLDAIKNMLESSEFKQVVIEKKFEGPTLLVYGEKSNYIGEKQIEEMKNVFPNMEVHCIKDGNHYLHVEKAEEFLDIVIKFINK